MTLIERAAAEAVAHLPVANWDLLSFLDNAKTYAKNVGAGVLLLLGVVAVVVGGVFLCIKLFGSQQAGQKHGWFQIIALIIVGGALSTGGVTLMMDIGGGGEDTIRELGGGTAIVQELGAADAPGVLTGNLPGTP